MSSPYWGSILCTLYDLGRGAPSLKKEMANLLSTVTSFVGFNTYLHLYILQSILKFCAVEREGGKHVKITAVRKGGPGPDFVAYVFVFLGKYIVSVTKNKTPKDVQRSSCCLFFEPHKTYKFHLLVKVEF
jgi:hypothetical protein